MARRRLLLLLPVAAALALPAAAPTAPARACAHDRSLGRIAFARGGALVLYDFGTCRARVLVARGATGPVRFVAGGRSVRFGPRGLVTVATRRVDVAPPPPRGLLSRDGATLAVVRGNARGAHGSQSIWLTELASGSAFRVYTLRERAGSPGPIELWDWSPDGRYLLFAIDPLGSASLAADGLVLRILDLRSGRAHAVATQLGYRDYRSWCGSNQLALVAGGDRIATHGKRLVLAAPPGWRLHDLWADTHRSAGSVACAPSGEWLAVLSQRASDDTAHARWELWRVALANGARTLLDRPPPGSADESPRWSRDERALLFVRRRGGRGELMLWRKGRAVEPLVSLGALDGFYGHRDWWSAADWTAGS